jgi:hypothetical protein
VPIVGPSLTFLELAPKPIPDVTLMLSDRFRFIARAFHTSLVSARAIGTDRTIVTTMSVAFINSILPQRDEIRQAARLKVLTQRQSSSIVCRWRLRRFILHSSASIRRDFPKHQRIERTCGRGPQSFTNIARPWITRTYAAQSRVYVCHHEEGRKL